MPLPQLPDSNYDFALPKEWTYNILPSLPILEDRTLPKGKIVDRDKDYAYLNAENTLSPIPAPWLSDMVTRIPSIEWKGLVDWVCQEDYALPRIVRTKVADLLPILK